MFDFSFPELTLILIVALLVVGPERLPKLAREAGMWVGRIRRYAARVQADIRRELEATEFGDIARDLRGAGEEFAHNVNDTVGTLRDTKPLAESLEDTAQPAGTTEPVSDEEHTQPSAPRTEGAAETHTTNPVEAATTAPARETVVSTPQAEGTASEAGAAVDTPPAAGPEDSTPTPTPKPEAASAPVQPPPHPTPGESQQPEAEPGRTIH